MNVHIDKPEDASQELLQILSVTKDRYASLKQLSSFDFETVANGSVAVIGAGALGNEILKNLALMNVGKVWIADKDTIEKANLSRSVLYRVSDEGGKKAEVAARRVKEINEAVQVAWFDGDIITDLGLGVLRRMNVVIGGLDNHRARRRLNMVCWRLGVPWIDGAIDELSGKARVFLPDATPCFECILSEQAIRHIRENEEPLSLCRLNAVINRTQGKIPTTPLISSFIAALQVQEAIKLLHPDKIAAGELQTLAGKELFFDGMTNFQSVDYLATRKNCSVHESLKIEPVRELPEVCAGKTTVREFLNYTRSNTGDSDAIISLNHDVVTSLVCHQCRKAQEVALPLLKTGEHGKCPFCGAGERDWDQASTTCRVTGAESFMDRTLADIGVPPLDILTVISSRGYGYYELTGDLETALRYD